MKGIINTPQAPASIGPYSQGFRAGDFIFVGQGSIDPITGKVHGVTIQEQTKQALENVENILLASGASLKQIVKITVILSDLNNYKLMNDIYAKYFSPPFPARVCVGAKLPLPEMLIEIDAVAYLGA